MNTQKGFAHAFLFIGIMVALIGALEFIFWQNFIHKDESTVPVVISQPKKFATTNLIQ